MECVSDPPHRREIYNMEYVENMLKCLENEQKRSKKSSFSSLLSNSLFCLFVFNKPDQSANLAFLIQPSAKMLALCSNECFVRNSRHREMKTRRPRGQNNTHSGFCFTPDVPHIPHI